MKSRRILSLYLAMLALCLSVPIAQAADTGKSVPYGKVAKAVIATIMGKNPSIIRVKNHTEKGIYHVSYVRPDDNTKWAYLCKFDGNKAIWAGAGSPTDPNTIGRWRTHPADSVIIFAINGNNVTIKERFSDGSSSEKTFNLSDL